MRSHRSVIQIILLLLTIVPISSCVPERPITASVAADPVQRVALANWGAPQAESANAITVYPQTYTYSFDAAMSDDGRYLATISQQILQIWDLESRVLLRNVTVSGNYVTLRFLESGKEIIVVQKGMGGAATPWQVVDIETGKVTDGIWSGPFTFVENISPDNSLATVYINGDYVVARVSDGTILHRWSSIIENPLDAFSEQLAMSGTHEKLILMNPTTGQELGSYLPGGHPHKGRFSPDGRVFICKVNNGREDRLEALDVQTMTVKWVRPQSPQGSWGFTRDGNFQFSQKANDRFSFTLLDIETGQSLYRNDESAFPIIHNTDGHFIRYKKDETGLALTPISQNMSTINIPTSKPSMTLLGLKDGAMRTLRHNWDTSTGLPEKPKYAEINFNTWGNIFSELTEDGHIYRRKYQSGKPALLTQYDVNSGTEQVLQELGIFGSASVSSDGQLLAAVETSYEKDTPEIYIYSLPSTTPKKIKLRSSNTERVEFATDDECLVVSSKYSYKLANIYRVTGISMSDHTELFDVTLPDGDFVHDIAATGSRESGYKVLVSILNVDSGTHASIGMIDSTTERFVWRSQDTGRDSGMAILGFANNNTQFLLARGSVVELRDVMTGQLVATYNVAVDGLIDARSFEDPASGRVYVTGKDRALYTLDVKQGKMVGSIFEFDNGEWVSMLSNGYFAASNKGAELMNVRVGNKIHNIAQFSETFYRPDFVAMAHSGGTTPSSDGTVVAGAVDAVEPQMDIAAVVQQSNPPRISLVAPTATSTDKTTINAVIELEDTGGGIGKVVWKLNGITLGVQKDSRGFVVTGKANNTVKASRQFELSPGQNEVEVLAYDKDDKVASAPARLVIEYVGNKRSKPRLIILAVGVDNYKDRTLRLRYSVADARSIVDIFQKQSGPLYESVSVHTMLDDQVTRAGLKTKFGELTQTVRPSDVFVFYVAGHGTAVNGGYYMIPYDYRHTNEEAVVRYGIGQDFLQEALAQIPAMKSIVFLDTCNSGAFTKDKTYTRGMAEKTAIDRLTKATGRATIVASKEDQLAQEGYKGHGVFTWILLQALSEADSTHGNRDNTISVFELSQYVSEKLPDLTYEVYGYEQVPQVRLLGEDFPFLEVSN
ncbi:MAG: caspase family protein [Pseudodesulfovibrio sp.]